MVNIMLDPTNLKVAAFLAQALDLDDDPATLAAEVVAFKRDANAGISSIELDSSVGAAAFLIYHYLLDVPDAEGRTGRQLFDADLATLETAAARDTPGPRIVAHAIAGNEAYILATTPATYRALTGQPAPDDLEASAAHLLPISDLERVRRDAASELLRLLRDADSQAATWLAAIRTGNQPNTEDPGQPDDLIAFNEEETALALYLLDERSIQHLLQLLNLILTTARQQAAGAVGDDPVA